ncbi:hypothetical protein PF010_g16952 [Phytophthora fragariae]|uniref:Chromo domain-containing protein n=2 Tax=Phytophthora fragariae TaxID=53985 RepID=A0A6G0KQ17_9STRA|nr:hypothetical protein PF003_g38135 [Phytophthora fragariae]KAE9094810.1 hypothetical protein PF010_g16952 [Phytophthora fragariae]
METGSQQTARDRSRNGKGVPSHGESPQGSEAQRVFKPTRTSSCARATRTATPVNVDEPEEPDDTDEGSPDENTQSLFRPGDRAWLYMERVKPGLTKMLAHRWHGPFRIKTKVDEYAFELDLSDRSGYRFYPVVHVSRLKAVREFGERPRTRLAPDVTEETRLDFDEELLPEDIWEPDRLAGEYEVDAIIDDRVPLLNSTERAVREFLVKWVGHEDPTWEPAANCGEVGDNFLPPRCIVLVCYPRWDLFPLQK